MTALALTVCTPAAPPSLMGRVLASRMVTSKREAKTVLDTNAPTWRDRLEPGERSFVGWLHNRDGAPVLVREHQRDPDAEVITYGRRALASMRKTTTTTKTAKGEPTP